MAAKTTRVVMPQLGESVHEGTISKWLVTPGDKVCEFEPMLEVDTDKVNAEVPAPVSGILREILAKEGETVQAGAEIAVVETGDGATANLLPTGGEGPAQPAEGQEGPKSTEGPKPPQEPKADAGPHRDSPGVQMAAPELKVDCAKVTGTGLGGGVTRKDLQEHASKARDAPAAAQPPAVPTGPEKEAPRG